MLSIWQTWNWKNIHYKNKTTCSFLLQKLCQEIHHRNICLPDLLYRREMTWDFTIKKSQITLQTSWTTLEDQAYSSCSFLLLIEISNQQIFAWDSSPLLFFCWHQNIPQIFPRKPGAWPWVWSLSISILLVSLSDDSQLTFGKKNDDFAVKSREENIFKKSLPWLWEEWFMIETLETFSCVFLRGRYVWLVGYLELPTPKEILTEPLELCHPPKFGHPSRRRTVLKVHGAVELTHSLKLSTKYPWRIHGTGIFTYIYHTNQPNLGKHTIHGSYGLWGSYYTFQVSHWQCSAASRSRKRC